MIIYLTKLHPKWWKHPAIWPYLSILFGGLGGLNWLVGCFGFKCPLRQYFSLYRAVSQRKGEGGERIDESKNVQTTPTRTYCKRSRPLPYYDPELEVYPAPSHHPTSPLGGLKRLQKLKDQELCVQFIARL